MSDVPEYALRWRGREIGPYPVAEINRLLDDHKIGMGHEIFYEDEWITLEAFFQALRKVPIPAPKIDVPTFVAAPTANPVAREKNSPLRIKLSMTPAAEPVAGSVQAEVSAGRPRYRLVFALLAVFLGFTGLHNFYARQWLTGLLQLLLSVATSLMSFGIIASWIWAVIEALVVRHDGDGHEML